MTPVHLLSDGSFKLDGGAMHGVVPKFLWESRNPPDEKNRILLGLNCILVDRGNEKILIESGIGVGHSEKFSAMYSIEKKRSLVQDLRFLGVDPSEITTVILTHLHFDHAGGLVNWRNGSLLFPQARIVVQEKEWKAAQHPHLKNQASYLPEFLEPMKKAKLELVNGEKEIFPGISVALTGGHTHGHQVVFLEFGWCRLAYLGDLVPTAAHVNPLWALAYDVEPEISISSKKTLLSQAEQEKWVSVLVHEPKTPVGTIHQENRRFHFHPTVETLPDKPLNLSL